MTNSSNPYARFIPREELGDFEAWKPGAFNGAPPRPNMAPPPPAAPSEPSAEEWQAKIAAARQEGYQAGYRDGLVALEGFKQSFAQQATAQIGALLASFDAELSAMEQQMAEAVARTALQLGRQVIRHELQTHPELVARVAAEAVNAVLLSARHIRVQVHPQDLPLVAEGAEEALQARGGRLMENKAIQRGGVLVESDVGSIDARIGVRWAQAAAALGDAAPLEEDA